MLDINSEDWAIWRNDKVTQAFLAAISDKREEAIKVLAYANYPPSREKIIVGAINAYTHVLEAKYEENQS